MTPSSTTPPFLRAEAMFWQGRYFDAEQTARAALAECPPSSSAWYRTLGLLLECCALSGQLRAVEETLALVEGGRNHEVDVLAYRTAGHLLQFGRADHAEAILSRGGPLAGAVARLDPRVTAWYEHARASRDLMEGNHAAALAHFQAAVRALVEADDPQWAREVRIDRAACAAELGNDDAVAELRGLAAEAEANEQQHVAHRARQHLGPLLARQGEREEAWQLQQAAADFFALGGHRRLDGVSHAHLSALALVDGELASAERLAREAVAILGPFPAARSAAMAALARALLARGQMDRAALAAGEGLAILRSAGMTASRQVTILAEVHAEALSAR